MHDVEVQAVTEAEAIVGIELRLAFCVGLRRPPVQG
jgi:hypothetical protein